MKPIPHDGTAPRLLRGGGLLGLIHAGALRAAHDPASSAYRPDIDGLRAVAVVAVLLFHGGLSGFSGGFVGVDVFFVISGYLIGRIVLWQVAADTFSLLTFYDRRVRRIIPPLLAVVAATLAMAYFLILPAQFEGLGFEVITAVGFVSNIWFWRQSGYFHPESETQPLLHTWSLSIEEQFYLFFPALILAAFVVSRRTALRGVAAVLFVSFALGVALLPYVPSAAFFLLPTRAWELLIGVLLAASLVPSPRSLAIANCAALAGLVLMLGSILLFNDDMPFPGALALIPVAGAGLFIWAGNHRDAASGGVNRLLAARPLVFVGLISYSLYLWHWPVYVATRHFFANSDLAGWQLAAAMALSILLAIVSVRFVEAPFRDRLRMPARRTYALLGAGVLIVCSAAMLVIQSHGAPQRFSTATLQLSAGAKDFSRQGERCRNLAFADAWQQCRIGATGTPTFLLWGDSHAAAISPAISSSARRAGRTGLLIESDGCFPVIGLIQHEMTRSDRDRCIARTRELIQMLTVHPELRTVILTARWYRGERYDPDPLAAALDPTVDWLNRSGRKVVVIAGLPVPDSNVPWRLASASMTGRALAPFVQTRLGGPIYRRLAALERERQSRTILLTPAFCAVSHCLADAQGRALFTDDNHLSAFAAEKIVSPYLDDVGLFETAPD